jgi:hypothetical protein
MAALPQNRRLERTAARGRVETSNMLLAYCRNVELNGLR